MRVLALGTALVGGICLVARLWVMTTALEWLGLGLVGVALALGGARLVRAPWLAVIAALGSVALAWSVLEVAREQLPDRALEAAVGGLATLWVAVVMLRRPGGAVRAGNHRS